MTAPVVVSAVSVIVVLGLGGLLTKIGAWYYALNKPSWQPPDWLFGPAWTVIGVLTAWSAVLAWAPLQTSPERLWLIALFALNGMLNILWSLMFFTWRRPDWALNEVVLLWLSILALILYTGARTPVAALLLGPYLVWVSFAAFLNLTILRLNPQFRNS